MQQVRDCFVPDNVKAVLPQMDVGADIAKLKQHVMSIKLMWKAAGMLQMRIISWARQGGACHCCSLW